MKLDKFKNDTKTTVHFKVCRFFCEKKALGYTFGSKKVSKRTSNIKYKVEFPNTIIKQRDIADTDNSSLTHSKWNDS